MSESPLPLDRALLRLQRMEMALIRAYLDRPQVLLEREYRLLRYALGLARLTRFVPGAAQAQTRGESIGLGPESEIEVDPRIVTPFRERVLSLLHQPLRANLNAAERLARAAVAGKALEADLHSTRQQLIKRHAQDFNAEALDAEVGTKTLVSVAGGGGGAGYVYIGAYARLHQAGLTPAYIVGSSIGTLIGAFRARHRRYDPSLLDFAKGLRRADVFGAPSVLAPHSMPGLARLHLSGVHTALLDENGEPLRLHQLEIPMDVVVGGIRRRIYDRLPAPLKTANPDDTRRFSQRLAESMWQLSSFISPNVVKEVVLGRDALTREVEVAEAIGFSAAIPGVLQYHPKSRSAHMQTLLDELRRRLQLAVLVDGGVANNVAARTAWRGVQSGRIGTRNVFILAWDCFHPRWDAAHLWLWPVTQAIQLQMPANRPYFDWLLQFDRTLSPINLLPPAKDFDDSYAWGWERMGQDLALVKKALEPVKI